MKKGDLVGRSPAKDDLYYIPDFESGVLLSDPYAAVFTQQTEDGEPIYSVEKIVVDILINNQIVNKLPTEFIVKIKDIR